MTSLNKDEKDIKELGLKARISLQEERRKRKEIVRLEQDVVDVIVDTTTSGLLQQQQQQQKKKSSTLVVGSATGISSNHLLKSSMRSSKKFGQSVKQSSQKKKMAYSKNNTVKHRLSSSSRKNIISTAQKRSRHTESSMKMNEDGWYPDTMKLSCHDLLKEQKSRAVRLHALPIGVQVENIQHFFSGLDVEQVFVLPPCDVTIHDFDIANEDYQATRKGTAVQYERYPNTFRLFVAFKSSPIADIAWKRSGETIKFHSPNHHKNNDFNAEQNTHQDRSNMDAAAISVTPVSKDLIKHFQKYASIILNVTDRLENVMTRLQLDSMQSINQIVWFRIQQAFFSKIHIVKQIDGCHPDQLCSTSLSSPSAIHVKDLINIGLPKDEMHYKRLVILHNQLLDILDSMEHDCWQIQIQPFDVFGDEKYSKVIFLPAVRNWIIEQCHIIQNCLVHFRRNPIKIRQREQSQNSSPVSKEQEQENGGVEDSGGQEEDWDSWLD